MDIKIEPVPLAERKPKPSDESALGFGKLYSDHMFSMRWTRGVGWHDALVSKYKPIAIEPSALVLHYGQTIFEGLKAYRNPKGGINLFRAENNFNRFNISAQRLDLPTVEPTVLIKAIEALIELDHEWVPHSQGASLYVRPFMFGVEPYVGLKSSSQVQLLVITGPVGAYYPEGFNPVKLQVCEKYSRAGPGGLGSVKTAANYAASLLAEKEAQQAGFTQVLWLDAAERKFIEEVGSMNILLKIGGTVITPPLGGTILSGITRDSVLALLRSWNVPVEERRISIDEVLEQHRQGKLEEIFGAGTAAVISPVSVMNFKGENYTVGDGATGPIAKRLFEELTGIQYGIKPDPFGWIQTLYPGQQQAQVQTANAARAAN
jgi:branched-chain amino acid aminotransferase